MPLLSWKKYIKILKQKPGWTEIVWRNERARMKTISDPVTRLLRSNCIIDCSVRHSPPLQFYSPRNVSPTSFVCWRKRCGICEFRRTSLVWRLHVWLQQGREGEIREHEVDTEKEKGDKKTIQEVKIGFLKVSKWIWIAFSLKMS